MTNTLTKGRPGKFVLASSCFEGPTPHGEEAMRWRDAEVAGDDISRNWREGGMLMLSLLFHDSSVQQK